MVSIVPSIAAPGARGPLGVRWCEHSMQPRISLCMVVKDEALLLSRALASARDAVDEIVVVDTGSTDGTPEIARNAGARVITWAWDGSLGRARNTCLREATGDWVLVLDGDETIAGKDLEGLRRSVEEPGAIAYWSVVRNYTRSFDLLQDWKRNRGEYPGEELASGCPGHTRFPVMRLFRRLPGVEYVEGSSYHTNATDSILRLGTIRDGGPTIHHFQWLKGGEAFIAGKQKSRLAAELEHLQQFPRDVLALTNAGRTLFLLGRDAEALTYLDQALQMEPASRTARLSRAIVRCETGEYMRALEDLDAAALLDPDQVDVWCVMGIARHGAGEIAPSRQALMRALELSPGHPLALNSLGVLCLDQGELDEAERWFQQALDVYPEHPNAAENLSLVRRAREESSRADHDQAP